MVSRPDLWVKDMADAGTDAFTFHLETASDGVDIGSTIEAVKGAGMKVGLAIKPGTAVEDVFPYVEVLDQVLVMTVEPVSAGGGTVRFAPLTPSTFISRDLEVNHSWKI